MLNHDQHLIFRCSLGFLLLCGLVLVGCQSHSTPSSPNIVYILADDLGWGDLQCYNAQSQIATPHLDRLAESGMKFMDMHSPSSVCTPTRYGILTGRYCWRSALPRGVLRGYGRHFIAEERMSVSQFLKEAGYQTGVVGKWHLGVDWALRVSEDSVRRHASTQMNQGGIITEMDPQLIDFTQVPSWGPPNLGFDYSFVLPASLDMDPYVYLEDMKLLEQPSDFTEGNDLNTGYTGSFWRAGLKSPSFDFYDVLPTFRKKAEAFLRRAAQNPEPFFLYLPLAAPHTPWVPTASYEDVSGAGSYGDFVQMVDHEVGEVLQTLEEIGADENTLVIFTSDNGPFWTPALIDTFNHRAAGALRGMKADAYEGGHRIPYIARWPENIPAGTSSTQLSCLTHLLATVSDLLEIPLANGQGQDSESLLPTLLDPDLRSDSPIVHHSSRGYFAVRNGDWKLIDGLGSGGFTKPSIVESPDNQGQLYHLSEDPLEEHNRFNEEPDKVDELREILDLIKDQ
ncbi:MAG: arylsulfatase [Saprospiraceae bacterium]|nr:arylsulfatase [Saprospiraceae bacterium]